VTNKSEPAPPPGTTDEGLVRHEGERHLGPARTSPYPVSRLAPAHDLVDTARQIAEADHMIGTVVDAKLQLIAEQIRALQQKAREILDTAQEDAELHRATCTFVKRPGHSYHLYRRPDGGLYFSMLSPDDWRGRPPHESMGSYRLEPDMSWTRL
jgi:hypothetical protein